MHLKKNYLFIYYYEEYGFLARNYLLTLVDIHFIQVTFIISMRCSQFLLICTLNNKMTHKNKKYKRINTNF